MFAAIEADLRRALTQARELPTLGGATIARQSDNEYMRWCGSNGTPLTAPLAKEVTPA